MLLLVIAHAAIGYGWAGFAGFFAITYVVALLFEASSIATGFPFGFYVHHLGPVLKLLGVPWLVPLGYVAAGWFAWTLACVLVRDHPSKSGGWARFTTPLIASFIVTGSDACFDPIGATARGQWTYRDPSGLSGVPLTNFLGWLLTCWVFYQIFALCEPRFRPRPITERTGYWVAPCLIWIAMAAQYPLMYRTASHAVVATGGRSFVVADIYETAVTMSLLTHVFVGLLAMVRALAPERARVAASDC